MDRAEQTGLGIAIAGHVILFGLLSVGFLATPNPAMMKSDPIDVQFVDEIGLEAAFPTPATEDPAQSVAPELGIPEDSAPPPAEIVEPAPIAPMPEPQPAPKAAPKAAPREAPPRPKAQAERPRERSDTRGSGRSEKPQRGSRLGDDFLKGLSDRTTTAKGEAPRAAVGAQAMSGIGAAIRRQIRPCYNLGPLGGTAAMEIVVRVRLRPDRDGAIPRGGFDVVGFTGVNGSNASYRERMAEVARNAVLDPRCSPLKLPAELYEGGWEDIIINFIPRDFS